MDFKELFRIIRRRWKSIAAVFVLALLVSGAVSYATPKEYESTSKVFISADTKNLSDAYAAAFFVPGRVKSYADLATHREVLQAVVDDLDLDMAPAELATKVTAVVQPETVIIVVTATDGDPRQAQEIAASEAEQLVKALEEVETPQGADRSQIKPSITDPATFSNDPVRPRTGLNLAVAAVLGLLLGLGLAFVRDLLDNSIKSGEELEAVAGAPVMAGVSIDRGLAKHPLLTDVKGYSPRSEAFRMLRTNLQYLDLDDPPRSLVITSAVAGEGKTSTATNLAIALAQAGRRVIILDGDLRRPRVARMLGLESSVGITTVLVGRTKLEDSIQRHAASGVHFLASGPTPPNPTEILQSHATQQLLARLKDAYDAVIIDAPPLLPVADAAILGTITDGSILVTRYGKTHRDELRAAAQRLQKVGGRLFGVVLNMVPRRASEGYYYYYYDEERVGPVAAAGKRTSADTKSSA